MSGASLAGAERLNEEPLAKLLARLPMFADQTTVGEWLHAQSPQAVAAFWELIGRFVTWVLDRLALWFNHAPVLPQPAGNGNSNTKQSIAD